MPIVVLISFLIGVVIGYQGASQLRQFGAEIFAVDLLVISVLRELGILLTAIIIAGRTASAYTAAIGSMKMGQEIDAMRTRTVFLVTHDLDTLHACCDRVAVLAERHVLAIGTLADMLQVDNPWVHEYFHGPRARAAFGAGHPYKESP